MPTVGAFYRAPVTLHIVREHRDTTPADSFGWVCRRAPCLAVTPDQNNAIRYTLTHVPTGASLRDGLTLGAARKLAQDLVPHVTPLWGTSDVQDATRTIGTAAVRGLLRAAGKGS